MAVLSDADRALVWSTYQSNAGRDGIALPLLKPELRAAIDAIDTWVDANQGAFNAAIPQPARGAMTTKEKAHLLVYVVEQRYRVS